MNEPWLQNLKKGDRAIIVTSGLGASRRVAPVDHVTKNFIVFDFGNFTMKFRTDSGYQAGDHGWHPAHLEEAISEKVADIVLKGKQYKVQEYVKEKVDWSTVPADVIAQVYVLLDPFVKEDKPSV
jgi:hypothetical protein